MKFALLVQCCAVTSVLSGRTSKWNHCGCVFQNWSSWSKCSLECAGGRQRREREVQMHQIATCTNFTDCATNDMGFQFRDCNTICYNGGSYRDFGNALISYCHCPERWRGSCCDEGKIYTTVFLFLSFFLLVLSISFVREMCSAVHTACTIIYVSVQLEKTFNINVLHFVCSF